MKILLTQGADPSGRQTEGPGKGETCLFKALIARNVSCVKALLEFDSRLGTTDITDPVLNPHPKFALPIEQASNDGNLEVVEMLLNCGHQDLNFSLLNASKVCIFKI